MKIPFNRPFATGKEIQYINEALTNGHLSGNGPFTKKCEAWFEQNFGCQRALLTHSCTGALEMAAILAEIKPGDEIIMPSYTFVSTANAFVLRGARIIFIDIRPDTMNIDERLIEPAITRRTKVIVPVHYGSVGCEMDSIMSIAKKHKLLVIEDAAQGVMAKYKGRYLGTIGHIGCYSFHETKNYTAGEGGAIVLNDGQLVERAEIVREKGTDRVKFFNGEVDKYTWVDIGSSYIPGEICAAFLYAQLEAAKDIYEDRMKSWNLYYKALKPLADAGFIELPYVPKECEHSAHMFYIKVKDLAARSGLIDKFKKNDILSIFHYVPLHSSKSGIRYGRFHGYDRWTTKESERLVRLPMYCRLSAEDIESITDIVADFYGSKSKIESLK